MQGRLRRADPGTRGSGKPLQLLYLPIRFILCFSHHHRHSLGLSLCCLRAGRTRREEGDLALNEKQPLREQNGKELLLRALLLLRSSTYAGDGSPQRRENKQHEIKKGKISGL